MTTVHLWVGATSPTSCRVRSKLETGAASARLAVSVNSDVSDPEFFGPVAVDAQDMVDLDASGLEANGRYYYAVETDGVLDLNVTGQFRTHPPLGEPADFTVAAFSCAGSNPVAPGVGAVLVSNRISNHPAHTTILSHDPLMLVHLGDIAYYDLGSGNHGIVGGASEANFRRMFDDVFLQPNQHRLYRNLATAFSYDDHDGGPNDHDSGASLYPAAVQVYTERVPHYDLTVPGSTFQAWQIARCQFVLWDVRSHRDPNTDPDGPNKTMLGQAQRDAFETVLATSTAECLVIMNPDDWFAQAGRADSWDSFRTERDWVIDRIAHYGWTGRVAMAGGDLHLVAIDTGTGSPGGIPLIQCASIDSTPSGAVSQYDLGGQTGRGQYGTIRVGDTGDRIDITLTGWVDGSLWKSHTHTILLDEPEPLPPPAPAPPAIAQARIRNRITWLGVNRVTGEIIAELPDITGAGARQLSDYVTAQAGIPLTNGGPGHVPIELVEAATDGQTGALVAVVNDVPLWMGLTSNRRGGTAATMRVGTATPESYFLKRHVHDHSFTGTDRAIVAQTLIGDAQGWDGVGPGLGFELDTERIGATVTRDYRATDRTTVYDALQALAAEGLEFEVYYDWADSNQTAIVKIVRIRRHIGRVSGTPAAMFETDAAGSVVDYDLAESWTEGDWANHVTAIGPGQGDDQPASAPAIAQAQLDAGVPIIERVFQPGNNITDPSDLQQHADADLMRAEDGTAALSITAMLNAYPRLGVDVLLGDQVSFRLVSPRHPAHRPLVGTRRVTGWTLDTAAGTWEPTLVDDPTLGAAS